MVLRPALGGRSRWTPRHYSREREPRLHLQVHLHLAGIDSVHVVGWTAVVHVLNNISSVSGVVVVCC